MKTTVQIPDIVYADATRLATEVWASDKQLTHDEVRRIAHELLRLKQKLDARKDEKP